MAHTRSRRNHRSVCGVSAMGLRYARSRISRSGKIPATPPHMPASISSQWFQQSRMTWKWRSLSTHCCTASANVGTAGVALDVVAQACAAEGVPFAGDTIERNLVYEGILETAKAEDCDLIVMGSHGRQGVKALILGSVAQKVLTHAHVPVLIVKG